MISRQFSMLVVSKSVFGHSCFQNAGSALALPWPSRPDPTVPSPRASTKMQYERMICMDCLPIPGMHPNLWLIVTSAPET